GVGRPPEGIDPADYLLSDFHPSESEIINESIRKAAQGIEVILREGFVKAMNKINRTKNQSKKEERIND
ncbi:MAG: aminoacyl-tRNA hydrolase, partial [Deltaproteobacteria bacterium]|nr:aminoacyl-tRNA hydrolase [Deltaproteobacteria bacterium]